jgi:hypothetical protein
MNAPSLRKLALLGIDTGQAREIRALIHDGKPTRALRVANAAMNAHGIEAVRDDDDFLYREATDYVNTGDSYAATLIFCRRTWRVFVGTIGDYIEAAERRGRRLTT